MPECWQFLLIDVAESPDGVHGDVPKVLTGTSDFFGLSDPRAEWEDLVASLPSSPIDVAAGWRPVPPYPAQPKNGASQYRALGRLAAVVNLKEIKERIKSTVDHLAGTDTDKDLKEIARLTEADASLGDGTENIYLVTSLAGGSGSGLFLDVANVLQMMGKKYTTILYTPDVFDELGPVGGNRGVTPNTMAAISELISAWENLGDFSEAENHVMQAAGLGRGSAKRRVADTHLIVGREASGYSLTTQNQVYHTAARAIAALTLNGAVNEEVQRYIFDNLNSLTPQESIRSLRISDGNASNDVATSIGFASVSTGRHVFGSYAAERVSRYLIEQIIDDDERVNRLLQDEDTFKRDARNFARRAGVLGLNRGDNQILSAVRGGSEDVVNSFAADVRKQVEKILAQAPFGTWNVAQVGGGLDQNFDAKKREAADEYRQSRSRRAKEWTIQAQATLLNETAQSIAENGLGLTIEFLRQLQSDLKEGSRDLMSDADDIAKSIKTAMSSAVNALAQVGDKVKLLLNSAPVQENLNQRQTQLENEVARGNAEKTAALLEGFNTGVVGPLLSELDNFRSSFRSSANRDDVKAVWTELAKGETPSHLTPTGNEIFLDSPLHFEQDFDDLLDVMFKESPLKGLQKASAEVLKTVWKGRDTSGESESTLVKSNPEFDQQHFIKVDALWSAGLTGLTDDDSQRGTYRIDPLGVDKILLTARTWQRERAVISDYTNIQLNEYLYPKDGPDRTADFIDGLERALSMSGCLAEPDRGAMQGYAGPKTAPTTVLLLGEIPVKKRTNGSLTAEASAVSNLLMQYAKDQFPSQEKALANIKESARGSAVEIVSVYKEKMHPSVFKSIAEPIRHQWSEVIADRNKRADFFTMRRSRVLPQFVPVSRPVLINMVKGWILATTLGSVSLSDMKKFLEEDGHFAIRILDPKASKSSGYISQFPDAVLRGGRQGQKFARPDILGSLLESMILAFASVEHGWLDPYVRLARLGGGEDRDLSTWLLTGHTDLPSDTLFPVEPDVRLAGATNLEERKTNIHKVLKEMLDDLTEIENKSYDLDDVLTASRKWELRHEYREALVSLQGEVDAVNPNSDDDGEV